MPISTYDLGTPWSVVRDRQQQVFQVYGRYGFGKICTITNRTQEKEAELAALIAAAPAMLDLLEEMTQDLLCLKPEIRNQALVDKAEALLDKIEKSGKTPQGED